MKSTEVNKLEKEKRNFSVKVISPDQKVLAEFESAEWINHIMSEKLCGVDKMIILEDDCWPIQTVDIDLDEEIIYVTTQREISNKSTDTSGASTATKKDHGCFEYVIASLADKAERLLVLYTSTIHELSSPFRKLSSPFRKNLHALALDSAVVAMQYSKEIEQRDRCLMPHPLLHKLYIHFWNDEYQELQLDGVRVDDLNILLFRGKEE